MQIVYNSIEQVAGQQHHGPYSRGKRRGKRTRRPRDPHAQLAFAETSRQGQLRRPSRNDRRERALRPRARRFHRSDRHAQGPLRTRPRRHDFSRRNRELPLSVQAKLLRILQEREYEARRRLGHAPMRCPRHRGHQSQPRGLHAGRKIRLDLYYRLNVFPVYVPASGSEKPTCLHSRIFSSRNTAKRTANL